MNDRTAARATHLRQVGVFLCIALLTLAAIAIGCGNYGDDDNENPMDPIDEGPFRRTPEELIEDFFETAYSSCDSALYDEMLCEDFLFEFLQADADSLRDILGQDNFWGRTLELRSAGALCRSAQVTGITLNIQVNDNDPYLGDDCVGCRQLEATVTLRVNTIGDGAEPLTYTVDSPQTFVTKPDPADPALWCLFRQSDRPRSLAKHDSSTTRSTDTVPATEPGSWGRIKLLFYR